MLRESKSYFSSCVRMDPLLLADGLQTAKVARGTRRAARQMHRDKAGYTGIRARIALLGARARFNENKKMKRRNAVKLRRQTYFFSQSVLTQGEGNGVSSFFSIYFNFRTAFREIFFFFLSYSKKFVPLFFVYHSAKLRPLTIFNFRQKPK